MGRMSARADRFVGRLFTQSTVTPEIRAMQVEARDVITKLQNRRRRVLRLRKGR